MKLRTSGALVAVLLAASVAACSDSTESPSPTSSAAPTTATTTPAEPPEQVVPVPGETLTVVFLQVEPASEGDDVFAPTVERLATLGYADATPIDIGCIEDGAAMLGVDEEPASRAVVLFFDSFTTADTFSTLWSGDIFGFLETTVCEQAAA